MANFRPHFIDRGRYTPGSFLDWYGKKSTEEQKYCPNHPQRVIKPQFEVCYSCYMKEQK